MRLIIVGVLPWLFASPLAAQFVDAPAPQRPWADLNGNPSAPTSPPFAQPGYTTYYAPQALPCSINVACQDGQGWDDAVRATVKISTGCSGVLLNNTSLDQTPYVMTAYHCGSAPVGATVNWTFEFNYQSPTCSLPVNTPSSVSMTGAVVRAAEGGYSDFILLELLEPVPLTYDVMYAGWSIEHQTPERGVVIGHPRQDLKKITLDDDPIKDLAGIFWDATFDKGTIELGSSGSPLFNQDHQFIGLTRSAITFDPDACSGPGGDDNAPRILFPKLSYNWDLGTSGARLSAFLDPEDTGALSLSSLEPNGLWINEVNADAHRKHRKEKAEFIELAGRAGTRLDRYSIDVYSCTEGRTRRVASQPLDPFVFADEKDGLGFFVLGGSGVDPSVLDQSFSISPHNRLTDLLPDEHGLLVLKDDRGEEVFDYRYDAPGKPQCAPGRTTRSRGDEVGYGTMGFVTNVNPTKKTTGTTALYASPGAPNDNAIMPPSIEPAEEAEADHEAEDKPEDKPTEAYNLSPAYPNPFNPQTQFTLSVAETQHVEVAIYNLLGQRVALLFDGQAESQSTRSLRFDAGDLPSGMYLIRIRGEYFTTTRTITLLK